MGQGKQTDSSTWSASLSWPPRRWSSARACSVSPQSEDSDSRATSQGSDEFEQFSRDVSECAGLGVKYYEYFLFSGGAVRDGHGQRQRLLLVAAHAGQPAGGSRRPDRLDLRRLDHARVSDDGCALDRQRDRQDHGGRRGRRPGRELRRRDLSELAGAGQVHDPRGAGAGRAVAGRGRVLRWLQRCQSRLLLRCRQHAERSLGQARRPGRA